MENYIITETSKARVCFVNVPEDGNNFALQDVGKHNFLCFRIAGFSFGFPNYGRPIKLPPGDWQLLPRLSQVSEEQAAGIVERGLHPTDETPACLHYGDPDDYLCSDAISSLITLARSLNIPEDQDPVVLAEPKK